MKALVCEEYGALENLAIKNLSPLTPLPGQLIVNVKATSVNFPDVLRVQGKYQAKTPLPFSPGCEVAGTIKAVGEGVHEFKVGERVIAPVGYGAFAEECVVSPARAILLPSSITFKIGAALSMTYLTVLHGLQNRGRLSAGETVVVFGASGGVGTAAIEVSKLLGARVIAVASTHDKLELCKKLGADEVINYTTENLKECINKMTNGKGADVVCDQVGGEHTEQAIRSLSWKGRLLVFGFAAGDIPKIPLNLVLLKERSIIGVHLFDFMSNDQRESKKTFSQLIEWCSEKKICPVISNVFSLDAAKDALMLMASRQVTGKIIIEINDL